MFTWYGISVLEYISTELIMIQFYFKLNWNNLQSLNTSCEADNTDNTLVSFPLSIISVIILT